MASKIEFKLFAPRNKQAALIGSFANWEQIFMKKNEQGFFRTVIELEDGIYQYKFRVQSLNSNFEAEQWVDVIDPYATDINEEEGFSILRVKDGKKTVDNYAWQHDDVPLHKNQEIVLYEMHVTDFTSSDHKTSKYIDVKEKLDYLDELGINTIQLMPVNEFCGDYSWGYKVQHFFATESSYGSTTDLKQLIDECHARGIRVIIDGIYNHSDEECPLILIDRDYWYYHSAKNPDDPDNYWGPEFNYEYYDEKLDIKPAWQFIGDVVRFWIEEYHIDGIRFDALKQLGNYDFLYWIAQQAKQVAGKKSFYNVGEHIPETPELTVDSGPMDGCWRESFRIFVVDHVSGKTFDLEQLKEVLDAKRQGFSYATNVVHYLASHDRNHLMVELADRGIFDATAFQRAKLAVVLQMTAVGIPMISMGEEFGQNTRQTPNQPNPLKWSLLENAANRDLWEHYQKLIALRHQNPALHTENTEFFYEDPEAKLLAYQRWNDSGSRVVVVVNLGDRHLANYCISALPADGTWYDWISDTVAQVSGNTLCIDLPAYAAKVFVTN
ncbi:alpha-amylase family glycosyl hydrolase [Gloeocapsopsis dulcis]|uniref:Alpha-amylase n=1 Tax=Gloeocapsopsis dulcis AAB1 = 1H9 TaxID=1433147 RepID=A0A6N8FSW8_9CHRO|nr:alpha-amylase family glycosyl hydrolase [Gloeocapsopsis dulcis]MUL35844.1 alpha-amylase [Gloeocapsopsis dulcis AAB1 = 1H9]WNN87690.1 alpha-amylase family glycosyl hydrolase [Gloeocapsopsis dulcis]